MLLQMGMTWLKDSVKRFWKKLIKWMFLQESTTDHPTRMMTLMYDSVRNQGKSLDHSAYVVLMDDFNFPAANWDCHRADMNGPRNFLKPTLKITFRYGY